MVHQVLVDELGLDRPDPSGFARDFAPVGFVVVGCGMGHKRARTVVETPGTALVAVVDADPARARCTGEDLDVPWSDSLDPWLGRAEAEVVYVLTPTGRHAEVALAAIEAGKHVLVTKPMEATLAACDRMIRAAEARGRLLAVDVERRFSPAVLGLRRAVRDGRLGRVLGGEVALKIRRTMDYFREGGGWRGTRRLDGGGVLSNQAIHHVDEAVFLLGPPARVRAEVRTQTHAIEAEDLAAAVWEFAGGAVLTLLATTSYPHDTWCRRLELFGTDGAAVIAGGGPLAAPVARYFVDGAWSDAPPAEPEVAYANAADNLACAVRTGVPLVCDGRDGRRTQAILDAMYRSAGAGGAWVEVEAELAP